MRRSGKGRVAWRRAKALDWPGRGGRMAEPARPSLSVVAGSGQCGGVRCRARALRPSTPWGRPGLVFSRSRPPQPPPHLPLHPSSSFSSLFSFFFAPRPLLSSSPLSSRPARLSRPPTLASIIHLPFLFLSNRPITSLPVLPDPHPSPLSPLQPPCPSRQSSKHGLPPSRPMTQRTLKRAWSSSPRSPTPPRSSPTSASSTLPSASTKLP